MNETTIPDTEARITRISAYSNSKATDHLKFWKVKVTLDDGRQFERERFCCETNPAASKGGLFSVLNSIKNLSQTWRQLS